jgi:uncharacterized protein (TIGR02594 family)
MYFKTRMMFAAGCAGLIALSTPAFSRPAPHGIAKHRVQHAAAPRAKPHQDRGPRLVSTPIAETPKRPMFGWPSLVSEARKYMGTNPTRRSRLWCATFMNMVLAKTGYAGTNSDAAKSFAQYGRRVSEPQIGAIAVLTRGRTGGHVGVVSGIDNNGNPIIISGNHGHRVGEAIYPRTRVIAYVMPSGTGGPVTTEVAARSHAEPNQANPANRNPSGGLESPITELLAAIEAEQRRSERPKQQTAQLPAPAQARPVEPRQAAQQQPVEYYRAGAQPHEQSGRRDNDPSLGELLGLSSRVQAAPPPPRVAPIRQRQV